MGVASGVWENGGVVWWYVLRWMVCGVCGVVDGLWWVCEWCGMCCVCGACVVMDGLWYLCGGWWVGVMCVSGVWHVLCCVWVVCVMCMCGVWVECGGV